MRCVTRCEACDADQRAYNKEDPKFELKRLKASNSPGSNVDEFVGEMADTINTTIVHDFM